MNAAMCGAHSDDTQSAPQYVYMSRGICVIVAVRFESVNAKYEVKLSEFDLKDC